MGIKDLNSLRQVFEEMEYKENLFERTICNTYYWKLIRIYVFNDLAVKLGITSATHPNLKRNNLKSAVATERIRLQNNAFFQKGETDYVVYRHRRRINVNEKFIEVNTEYLPYLVPELKNKRVTYIETGIAFENRNVEEKSQFLMPSPITSLVYRLFFKVKSKSNAVKNELAFINKIIESYFGFKFDLSNRIINNIKGFKLSYNLHKRYLKKKNPGKVFLVCSYGKEGIIAAARSLGIETIEIQHGIIYPFHMGYSYPQNASIPYFPDKIMLYGDFWKDQASFPIERLARLAVGNPYAELQIKKYSDTEKEKNSMLFISSGQYGVQLSKLAVDYHKQHPEYRIYYKLHPSEFKVWPDLYPHLKASEDDGLIVVEDKINLYELFARSNYLVGVNSTAIYESFSLLDKVILYNTSGIEVMKSLATDYNIPLVESTEGLYETVIHYPNNVKVDRDSIYKNVSNLLDNNQD